MRHSLRQHLPDAAQRLPCTLFVLNQREANMVVAIVPEADAGAYGYLRLRQQQL